MDLLTLLIVLIVIGAGLYLLQILPIDATIKRVIQVVLIIVIIIWLLKMILPMAGLA